MLEGQREVLQVRAAGGQQVQVMIANLGAQGYCQVGEEAAAAQGLAQLCAVEAPAHLVSAWPPHMLPTGLPQG